MISCLILAMWQHYWIKVCVWVAALGKKDTWHICIYANGKYLIRAQKKFVIITHIHFYLD